MMNLDFEISLFMLRSDIYMLHGASGFTSPTEEGLLLIFIALKIYGLDRV
jgi:hypothetical protein